jgi:hypothetical protein
MRLENFKKVSLDFLAGFFNHIILHLTLHIIHLIILIYYIDKELIDHKLKLDLMLRKDREEI